ncbi:MlaC/ttg2D family ABC transporter substrate-binding protein [Teredinibacter waterburyi]|uniref:MlaC/ttg2D family ABC transporter substrate-binding protein n=1 Tax=Teredinibacter waterburyi TaxID=1500538 RepID=UPI00165FD17D|nr:ABC transporter substrate-binding protein [Teredinibacter waterburyi]
MTISMGFAPNVKQILARFALFCCACGVLFSSVVDAASPAPAAVNNEGPVAIVEQVTKDLMSLVATHKGQLDTNPTVFFNKVETLLDEVIAFPYIAKNVMGPDYWNKATPKQQQAFVENFKRGMVETYAKGMASNLDLKIEVMAAESEVGDRKASVVQRITGPDSTNRIVYTLGLGRSGEWKLLNVVLNGINLGVTFRGQFNQSVKDHKGDLQAAIDAWH